MEGFSLQNQRGRGAMLFTVNSITSAKRLLEALDDDAGTPLQLSYKWVSKTDYQRSGGEQYLIDMMDKYDPDKSVVVTIGILVSNGRALNPSSRSNDTWFKDGVVTAENCNRSRKVIPTEETTVVGQVKQLGHICTVCSTISRRFVCSKCKDAKYCSKDCQKADWKVHKQECADTADLKLRRWA